MSAGPSPTLENSVAPGVRVARIEPLQARIEKNRWKFVGFMVAFTTSIAAGAAVAASMLASVVTVFLALRFPSVLARFAQPFDLLRNATVGVFLVALVLCWAWAVSRLAQSEHHLIERLQARVPRPDTLRPTRSALHDVALAAGLQPAPTLYVIETGRVNAFVLGRSPKRVRVGVTTGFLERIAPDEQRAVFANLIARVLSRDTLWATAASALMGPIWAWRDRDLARDPRMSEAGPVDAAQRTRSQEEAAEIMLGLFLVYGTIVIVTELLSWYHREASWTAAEKADAEGMMLLKDPKAMLSALEHVLERDNFVPSAGDAYSQLFYCWAGFGFAAEDDPEMRRVARLRETLGAEGAAYVQRPNVPRWSNPPVAPRLDLLDETTESSDGPGML